MQSRKSDLQAIFSDNKWLKAIECSYNVAKGAVKYSKENPKSTFISIKALKIKGVSMGAKNL